MTTIADALELASDYARRAKEHRIGRGSDAGHAVLFGYRGEELVAVVTPHEHERDAILQAATVAAVGFALDLLALTFEVYVGVGEEGGAVPRNPITGKPWEIGEMQEVAELHDGVAKGYVDEALGVMVHNRAGDSAMATMPFRIRGTSVEWLEHINGGELSGIMHSALASAMSKPALNLAPEFQEAMADLSPEEATTLEDVATARFLASSCQVALHAEPGTYRADYLARSGEWEPRGRG